MAENVRDPHHIIPIFVNQVVGRGCLNGVVNLTMATYQFTPRGEAVDTDMVVSARLRLDMAAARQLHAELGALFECLDGPVQATDILEAAQPNGKAN